MSHHHNFFTPEAEQVADSDPDAFYHVSHQGFTSRAPGYAAQATYQTIEHPTMVTLPFSTGSYVPPEPAYSSPQPNDWRPFPVYSHHSPTTAYSTSPPTTNFPAYDSYEVRLQVPESGQPTSGSSRSGSPNSTDLHNYGYPSNDGTWTCKYPGCSSKSVFSRGCDLRKHFNRHTKSLFCRHEGCPQFTEGGFSSKKDRARHEAKHNPGIVCEWDGCNRVFSRMDNMKDHVRRIHRRSIGS